MPGIGLGLGIGIGSSRRRGTGGSTPTPTPTPLTVLVAEGDSITFAAGSTANAWMAANPGITAYNCAVSGSGIGSMRARLSTTMAHNPSHMTILIGANDLMEHTSAQDFVDDLFLYVSQARAANTSLKRAGVCGVPPIDEAAAANSPPAKNGYNARAALVNALLRSAVGNQIDFYIPIGDHPDATPANWANGTYSVDGLHPNAAGQNLLAPIYAAAMDAVRDVLTGNNPAAYTYTDRTNAALSTAYSSRVMLTGMGMGRTATASVSGAGQIARGQGALGTGSVAVTNGDVLTAAATSSASNSTGVDTVVTAGSRSDTFTITTAPLAPADFAANASPLPPFNGAFSYTTKTFTAVPFVAGRPYLVGFTDGSGSITGVSIGGESFTATGNGGFMKPTPVTAGNYDVVVTLSSTSWNNLYCYVGTATGLTSSTAVGASALANGYHFGGVQTASPSISLPSGGIGIGWGRRDSGNPISTFGPSGALVQDYGDVFFWKFTSSGAPTYSQTNDGNSWIIAAGFQ